MGAFGWTKTKKASKKRFNHAGACRQSFCGNATGVTGAFLLLLNLCPRSLVKKWPGTMQLLLRDPPQAIRKLTDACYRAF
ncbi:hypothetical protein BS21228_22555 (plasmid) [Bacillus subtilis]|nr:hypothetical protein BS21228_22555 [Bacillus subtilis]